MIHTYIYTYAYNKWDIVKTKFIIKPSNNHKPPFNNHKQPY